MYLKAEKSMFPNPSIHTQLFSKHEILLSREPGNVNSFFSVKRVAGKAKTPKS